MDLSVLSPTVPNGPQKPPGIAATVTEGVGDDGLIAVRYDAPADEGARAEDGHERARWITSGGYEPQSDDEAVIVTDSQGDAWALVATPVGAVTPVAVLREAPLNLADPRFGLENGGNIATALGLAQAALGTSGGAIAVPPGEYTATTPLAFTEGQRFEAVGGGHQRWRSTRNPVKINYTGTEAAVKVQPAAGANRESVELVGIHFDGAGATGSVDGLLLDGSATPGDVYIEGVLIDRCTFTNFPRYQARLYGQVFDITFRRCAFNNADRTADNLVHCDVANAITSPSQLLFDDCFWAPYTAGKWCFHDDAAVVSTVRFTNGTMAPYVNANPGANGISKLAGGLQLLGTHIEGLGTDKSQIGVRYSGVLGALILPSYCGLLSTGVEVGNSGAKTQKARGAVIGGTVSGNTVDVRVWEGGSRRGTVILGGGEHDDTPPVVEDLRLSSDGIKEVLNLTGSSAAWPSAQIFSPPIQLDGFNGDGYVEFREQAVATPAPAANHARIVCEDNGAGKTRVGVRFATGAVQWFATEP
jgi:hypothetical protein